VIFSIRTSAKRWRCPTSLRTRFFGLYLKTRIFLSLAWRSTVPKTTARRCRRSHRYGAAVRTEDHAIERHRGADLLVDQVGADDVAFGDAQLLAAGLNDRVHNRGILSEREAPVNALG